MKDNLSFRIKDTDRDFVDSIAFKNHWTQGEAARFVLAAGITALKGDEKDSE